MLEGLPAQETRKRGGAIMRLAVQWSPAPCWNRSSASPAWGSTAEAARPCSAPTEMGLAPAIPWEPAEVGSPVSAAHCNCKGMERGPWTWCRSQCTSRSQLCSRVRLCTFLQDDFNCNSKEKYTLFQKKHIRIPEIMANKCFLYEADVQTRTKSPLTSCQNLDLGSGHEEQSGWRKSTGHQQKQTLISVRNTWLNTALMLGECWGQPDCRLCQCCSHCSTWMHFMAQMRFMARYLCPARANATLCLIIHSEPLSTSFSLH